MPINMQPISVRALPLSGFWGRVLILLAPLLDGLLGLKAMNALYVRHGLKALRHRAFVRGVLDALNIQYTGTKHMAETLPASGAVVVVSNHPYGAVEGLLLADMLSGLRSDVKFMANTGLHVFKEMADFFIFTNPLVGSNPKNVASIRACRRHLDAGGVLVLFPAGRVSSYQPNRGRITDASWNRIAARLALNTSAAVLPVFFHGHNSRVFHGLGRMYWRLRLLMLARELLKLQGRKIEIAVGQLLKAKRLAQIHGKLLAQQKEDGVRSRLFSGDNAARTTPCTDFLRVQTYLLDTETRMHRRVPSVPERATFTPIPPANHAAQILSEVASLPQSQHLFRYHGFSVYCGYRDQLEHTVREITRAREITFRVLDEGSGNAYDTDQYDDSYLHLFVVEDATGELISAYRMGQTDRLLQDATLSKLYLSRVFEFDDSFFRNASPALEMGRSFVVEKHQKKIYGLYLLWRGIGTYLVRNPRYRTLYGTVSLSRTYAPQSIALMGAVLARDHAGVQPRMPLGFDLHPELQEYLLRWPPDMRQLSMLVQAIECDGKDLPSLLKQYAKLGARFHCLGLDPGFSETPGLLLSVCLPSSPMKSLRTYLGTGVQSYLEYSG